MVRRILVGCIALVLGAALFPCVAFASLTPTTVSGATGEPGDALAVQATTIAKPMNLKFTYSAYLTNGKGAAYKSYMNLGKTYAEAFSVVIHKARIKGNKLYLSGKFSKNTSTANATRKVYTVKNKAYELTSSTKYYRHTGNNNFYEKYTKAKMKKYLETKSPSSGGDIYFSLKNGKVAKLSAQ